MKQALVVVLVAGLLAPVPGWSARGLRLGDSAPEITAEAIKGEIPELGGGYVTVVEFWATWCGPCRKTIPHLTQVQYDYEPVGVAIVGISNEDAATVKPFVRKMGRDMDYAVAVDENNATFKAYMGAFNVTSIPHAFIVDGDNRIAWHGHPGSKEMINVIEELTAEDGE